jgi:uncharacterized protein YndB with AHSA1/START domain
MTATLPVQSTSARFERSYQANVQELWELWTTKEGFESWWGPEGFGVDVHELDVREGGTIFYDMVARGPEQIAFMKQSGQPVSHETRGTFAEVVPMKRLVLVHVIDFVPGQQPYENHMEVEFSQDGPMARMVITVEAHKSAELNKMATRGMESQLTKVEAALESRR